MNKFNMKTHLLIILLGMTNYCYSCGSDGNGFIEVSQDNNLGVTIEILEEGKLLITLPHKFKEGDFAYAYLFIGKNEKGEPDISVPIANYSGEDYIVMSLNLSDEMSKIATIIASYTIKGTLCYAGSITLTGFDKLEFSQHWRDIDISNLFSRIQKLKKGMSLKKVWKTLRQPIYESTLYPRSLTKTNGKDALIYHLTTKSSNINKTPVIKIFFNKETNFDYIEFEHVNKSLIPTRLLTSG